MLPEYVKESWDDLKAKLKQKFSILTDNELKFEDDKKNPKTAEVYFANTKEELQRIIKGM